MSIKVVEGNVVGLREISDEEKLAWWRENIGGPETYNHVAVDGGDSSLIEQRTWTEEEWKAFVLKHGHHPDQYKVDLSYIGKRREEYPPETDQIGVIWRIIENISASLPAEIVKVSESPSASDAVAVKAEVWFSCTE